MTNWLLLHGTPLGPAIWKGVLPLLDGDVAVPAITPGAGAAVRGQQHVIARRLSEGHTEGEPPRHVVGHSYGGQVALELAIQAPQLVAAANGTDAQRHSLQAVFGELIQTTVGTWITRPPSRCANGTVATIPADR